MSNRDRKLVNCMLNVILREEVKEYMRQHHHNEISLNLDNTGYIPGNVYTVTPHIHFEAPKDIENYETYMVDDVKVYVEKDVATFDNTIEFVEESFLGIHRCHVNGVRLDKRIQI